MRVLDSGCALRDDQGMAEQWFIRVEGKEYGPADLSTLREWKSEGRVLPTNEARRAEDVDLWATAATIAGLFEAERPPVQRERVEKRAPAPARQPTSLGRILGQTFRIYFRGFPQYLALTLLIVAPSLCAQIAAPVIKGAPNVDVDLRTLVGFAFAFCMSVLAVVLWPIYIAGIQILTAQLAGGDRISFLSVLNAAARFWPRVAGLCIYVYLIFFLLTLFALALLVCAASANTLPVALIVLALLVIQIWLFSRFFINVLFWQQFAVLEDCNASDSLGRSRALARGRPDLPWYRRPLWRGGLVVSLWLLLILALNWPMMQPYWQTAISTTDPQTLLEKWREVSQVAPGSNAYWLALAQALLRPLLGISFVLLYLDTKIDM
jgi:hypothetical protein